VKMNLKALLGLPVSMLIAQAALAHHSFAMFDRTQKLSAQATVKEVEWTNPHCWLHLWVTDSKGAQQELRLEAGSPGMLARTGWKSTLLKPGDAVTVMYYPTKDASSAGDLISVVLPNGRLMGPGGNPGPPPAKSGS
jgi:hypothetical protein